MTTDTQNHTQPPKTWVHPIKQLNDDREYCVFTLPNGLQVTTVSDPNTTMSACALDIGVGSFSDPVHIQGLAHFLEHMLFLGTEKYPDENSYNETLAKNGGVSNAYTTFENTNYYFSVKSETLNEMLDRFSQFFIAPLFTETATGREMNAVHSEHQKNVQSDPWRFFQMIKNAINPKHPLGRFATGNLETLRDDPAKNGTNTRAELLDFHKKFYSANIMKVCILGSESSEVLRQWASDFFGPVKNHNIERPTYGTAEIIPPPTTQIDSMTMMTPKTEMNDKDISSNIKNTCKDNTKDDTKDTNEEKHTPIYRIYPVNAQDKLIVHWSLAPDEEFYRSGPLSHISELMGHEGEGSILETLKGAGYATSLSSGPQVQCSGTSVFSVSIILTQKGLEKYEDVLQVIYSYLDILRHASDEEWKKQHEMKAAISEMEFQYSPRSAVYSYASDIATNLHKYAPEDVLSGGRLFKEFDLPLIREYIKHMVPQNMLVFLSSQSLAKPMGFSKDELKAVQEDSAAAAQEAAQEEATQEGGDGTEAEEMSDKKGNVQATPVTATPTTATPNPVKGQFGPIHTDKYYGTKYTVSSLPLAYTTALLECYDTKKPATSEVEHVTLHLPRLNPFIATDFTVYTSEAGDTKVPGTIKTLGAKEKLELSRIPPRRIILDHQGKVITEFPASEKTNLAFLDKLNDICLDFDPLAEVETAFETAAETAESSKTEPKPTKAGDAADKTNVATHMRDEAAELYYKLDVSYEEPKLTVVNIVYSSEAYSTIRKHVLTTLFCRMFNDALTADILYDAELAGLSVAISETSLGVQIYFTGFSQKLIDFMKVIYERLHTQSYDPLRFEMNRNAIIMGYRAQFMIDTYGQCNYLASVAVNDPLYHFRDKLLEIQDITFEEFNAFWPSLFRRTRLSTLVHGNATYEQALEAARIAQKSLQKYVLSRSEIRWQRSIIPDTGLTWVKATNSNPDCAENAVSVSYYVKDCTPLKSALAQLLTQCISDKAFDKLRTNEQLGYIVANYASRARNTLTVTFLIQSSRSAMYLDSRIESFIAEVGIPYVESLDDENFEQFKQSLLSQLNKPDDSIDAEARRHITAMQTVDCAFTYPLRVIKEIEGVTKEQVVAFAKEYLSFSPDRRKVSTHIYGCNITVPKKFEIIQPEDDSIKRVPENIHFDEKDITIVTLPTIAQFKSVSSYVPLGNLRM